MYIFLGSVNMILMLWYRLPADNQSGKFQVKKYLVCDKFYVNMYVNSCYCRPYSAVLIIHNIIGCVQVVHGV